MSAYVIPMDWRIGRAEAALIYGTPINIDEFADLFDSDVEETVDIFQYTSFHLGIGFCLYDRRDLH
jgi:hypothetical protein